MASRPARAFSTGRPPPPRRSRPASPWPGRNQRPRLAGPDHEDARAGAGVPGHQRRRPADVERGQRQGVGHVAGEPRPEAGGEEDGLPRLDPVHLGVDGRCSSIRSGVRVSETRVAMRSPGARLPAAGWRGPTAATRPMSMPARAGDRVLQLAALRDDAGDLGGDAGRVAPHRAEIWRKEAESTLSASTSTAARPRRGGGWGRAGRPAGGGRRRERPRAAGRRGPRWSRRLAARRNFGSRSVVRGPSAIEEHDTQECLSHERPLRREWCGSAGRVGYHPSR